MAYNRYRSRLRARGTYKAHAQNRLQQVRELDDIDIDIGDGSAHLDPDPAREDSDQGLGQA